MPLVLSALDSCININYNSDGTPVTNNQQITILEHKAQLYRRNMNSMEESRSLDFNTKYFIVNRYKKYFGIKRKIEGKLLGYVKLSDVFCGGKPMIAKSGLLKKFFIKTEVHEKGTTSFVKAYPSSSGDDCGVKNKHCAKLKRFNSYYIFKEEQGRYLLSKSNEYRAEDILTGWVNKKDGFIWKTAIGVRPADRLKDSEPVYFYISKEDAKADNNKNEILGGMRWYDILIRMPVLEKINIGGEEYYKVALSIAGIGVEKKGNSLYYTNKGSKSAMNIVGKHNEVDIMFLVDGTKSMQPYIDKIIKKGGLIDRLSTTLMQDQKYKGLTIRTSYRIYRDGYAGDKNLGDGESITATCGESFTRTSFDVKASSNDKDDFKENMFGGINRALKDMRRCPNNKKIIFVIGDAGDRDSGSDFNNLVRKLKKKESRKHNTILVFIQTPRDSSKSGSEYSEAYNSFSRQVKKFKAILDPNSKGIVTSFKSDDTNIINNILNTASIDGYLNLEFLREIKVNLENGENLVDIIERLSSHEKYKNIPGIYKEEIINKSCKELGQEACEGKVYNLVIEGFIKVTENISEDVFFIQGEFSDLRSLMDRIKWNSSINREDRRTMLVELLRMALAETTGQTVFSNFKDTRIDEFLNSHGLPTRKNSPIFQHTIAELLDSNKVEDKVIKQLFTWISTSKDILRLIDRNEIAQLEFKEGSSKNDAIPAYIRPIRSKDFPRNKDNDRMQGYHYHDEIQNIRFLWVPKEFLP